MGTSLFTIYRSTDSGAPPLSGASGTLITVLDAVLVNGYGAKSGAGWTKSLSSGSTRAAYRQGSGLSGYLRVYDETLFATGYVASGGIGAFIGGANFLSSFEEKSGWFPQAYSGGWANNAYGVFGISKSVTADTTQREWVIAADPYTVYMFVRNSSATGVWVGWAFGEIYSYKTNDSGRNIIIGRTKDSAGIPNSDDTLDMATQSIYSGVDSHYLNGNCFGFGLGGKRAGKHTGALNSYMILGNHAYPGPNPENGEIFLTPVYIHDVESAPLYQIRGEMRGFWNLNQAPTNYSNGDTFSGTGDLVGKTFFIIKPSANNGCYVIETSNTVKTN